MAAAPISWGVCEVPGWGYQLPAERMLAEARGAGIDAVELGPEGYLPPPLLASSGMRAVGGFVPLVLHDTGRQFLVDAEGALDSLAAAGAGVLVVAAATSAEGYDARPDLDARGWRLLLANLERVATRAAGRGVTAVLHPHAGTMVEGPDDVERVLAGCDVPLCLDTGHLLIGGSDPVQLARRCADRIAHVHLKDVDAALATRVRAGVEAYTDAVRAGLYRPLGQGDVDIAAIVASLEHAGYGGWYVMEQDTVLGGEPDGDGPLGDVRASLAYLRGLA